MFAQIVNTHSPYHGQSHTITRIVDNDSVLIFLDGEYVSFAMAEVKITGTARLGKAILDTFAEGQDQILRDKDITSIAKRAARVWPCTITCCESAIHQYVWN